MALDEQVQFKAFISHIFFMLRHAGTRVTLARRYWLDKRQKNRGAVPTYLHYKRELVPVKERAALLNLLQEKLADPNFFENLPFLCLNRVKVFDFNGTRVVIKLAPNEWQGLDFKRLRGDFLAHQRAVRRGLIKPQHYTLRSPRVYGVVGHFLVMEYVTPLDQWRLGPKINIVKDELKTNFLVLQKRNLVGHYAPQSSDLIPAGETNPSNPEESKLVVFLPYDYV